MKSDFLKELFGRLYRLSGGDHLLRKLWVRRRACILYYHDPAPEVLERHLARLTKHYGIISLDRLLDALRSGHWGRLPSNPLVITIDDGHAGNAALAPVLRRYQVRPTILLCRQIVGTLRHYWFMESGDDPEPLKALPHERLMAALAQRTGFALVREYESEKRQALNPREIAALRDCVDYGAHTRFHVLLDRCGDEECRREIQLSRGEVERLSCRPCAHFSYPNGNYGTREAEMVRDAGYASARTCEPGWVTPETDPYRLPAMAISDDASVDWMLVQMTGIPQRLRARVKAGRARKRPLIEEREPVAT